jgi:TolA-binding protein
MCQTILREYPNGKDAPAALYKLGEIYQDNKHEYQTAVRYYKAFAERYPDLNSTPVAMFVTAFIYNNNLQMVDSAKVAYMQFLAKFPQHELAASAKFELDNLGRTPDEIIGIKKEVATDSKKLSKKK